MRKLIAVLLMGLLLICPGCARVSKTSRSFSGPFDTMFSFSSYGGDFEAQFAFVVSEFVRLDAIFDCVEPHEGVSGAWALNAAGGRAIRVEPELVEILLYAREMYARCDKVNVAMGAVTALWREAIADNAAPDPDAIAAAGRHADFSLIQIDAEKGCVALVDPDMRIDLGAIAKGWAVQKIADALGDGSFLIDAGGNVIALGAPLDGRDAWAVGVDNPDGEGVIETLRLLDMAAVTSGSAMRFFYIDGKMYSHIIDPETLAPAEIYRQVTIIADNSQLADWLSTAAFLLDIDASRALVEKMGAEAIWIAPGGEIIRSAGLEAFI